MQVRLLHDNCPVIYTMSHKVDNKITQKLMGRSSGPPTHSIRAQCNDNIVTKM